jgi:hypothetical protein
MLDHREYIFFGRWTSSNQTKIKLNVSRVPLSVPDFDADEIAENSGEISPDIAASTVRIDLLTVSDDGT